MRIVEADSVADYLNRYYKKEGMTPTLRENYERELEKFGHVSTSRHDNITGEMICWPAPPGFSAGDEVRPQDYAA